MTRVYIETPYFAEIFGKFRATFLSLSQEKKATSAGLKRLRRSRRPLAYSLNIHSRFGEKDLKTWVHVNFFRVDVNFQMAIVT